MQNLKPFKSPPKKHQPKDLPIIYEDHDIIVVDKRHGLLTIGTDTVRDNTAYFILNEYVRKGNPKARNRIFIVHRLDKETSGVIVFAKNESAKRFLQDQWQSFEKKYIAVVHGILDKPEGIITSYLMENPAHKMFSGSDSKNGQLAKTGYKVLRATNRYSMLEIDLLTGRKNQIRVHFSEKGNPVVGDRLYGQKKKGVTRLMLHAATLKIVHPYSRTEMTFEAKIPAAFKDLLKD